MPITDSGMRPPAIETGARDETTFKVGNRTFDLRRVAFPADPTPEWFVIDLLRNADAAGVEREELVRRLAARLRDEAFDTDRLFEMAARFGSPRELDAVRRANQEANA